MPFNYQAAKAAGYSDEEINQFLKSEQTSGAAQSTPQPTFDSGAPALKMPEQALVSELGVTGDSQPVNPYGFSVEDLYKAKATAQSAGDKAHADFYDDLIKTEEGYKESIGDVAGDGDTFGTETDLRKEFRNEVNDIDFKEMRSSYEKITETKPTAAGDLSLIFAYMKLLDPTSVVREGEQATAEKARGVPATVLNTYNKVVEGRKLNEDQRQDFKNQATALYNATARNAMETKRFYDGLAKEQGLSSKNVTGALGEIQLIEEAQKGPEQEKSLSFSSGLFDGAEKAGKGVFNFMLGNAKKTFQDIAQAIPAERMNTANQKLLLEGVRLAEAADSEQDLRKRQFLLEQAQSIFDQVSSQSQETSEGFTEDVQKGVAQRSIETGLDIAGTAGLATSAAKFAKNPKPAIQSVKKTAGKATEIAKKPFQDKAPKLGKEALDEGLKIADKGKSIRNKAINEAVKRGDKVDGNSLYQAIDDWGKQAKRANLKKSDINAIDDIVNNAKRYKGQRLKADTAKGVWDEAKKGFTASGKAGDSLTSGYHRALRDAVRGELDKVAPGFDKGTKTIKQGLDQEKLLKPIRDSLSRKDIKDAMKADPAFAKKVAKALKTLGISAGAIGFWEAVKD